MVAASELSINTNASALAMAETIMGDGVTVTGASYSGDNRSSGIFSGGDETSPGVTPSDSGVILSTGRATNFTNSSGQANQDNNQSSNMRRGIDRDDDFDALAGARTYDASFIEIDFIPDPETNFISLQFVFSSDEYPEYINSIYNDVVGIWVDGQPVDLSFGTSSVTNVNEVDNQNLYNDNTGDQFNTEMDGFTVTMSVKIPVTSGEVNSLKIGIADVSDSSYDSNLLIAAKSGQSALLAFDDTVSLLGDQTKVVDVMANDDVAPGLSATITHINGIAVSPGDTVTLATGQTVGLNADGTLTLVGDGTDESFSFTYTLTGDPSGVSDVGMVTVDAVPCFVAGTLIELADGRAVPVETLTPGDMVLTHDNGPQPLRWIGCRRVPAKGKFAPIHIAADTFGDHDHLLVSPLHRILIRDVLAELLFGEREVLVAARDLVNDLTVRRIEGEEVVYVHILFDQHQVVYSQGLATESFLPGPQATNSLEHDAVEEICALFPELDPLTGTGYSPAARRTLRPFEARLLAAQGHAA
ncbi:Hint domain-containing protein [Aliiroseovarius crassostreae]|uniref:Hint domain-containing protein n=1 Tax=Aliiroseovarius crassostreae TaxID=154981 RepID=UPI0022087B86|nr:Hint domain-containing protein [Aliiroseovarius crassostreae]UWP91857.1 Hint domain-containing protein [Aliiroseovarius crassostreae]UWP98167.1 Hint domain-containing protein [Aliiroseovarius crassostreae]